MRFVRNHAGICFLWWKHNCHFFVGVAHFVSVAVDVVAFVAADVVVGDVLVVCFYVACVVADIAVVLPNVSGFLLEAVDILFDI